MSVSNEELLFNAAESGDLVKVKDLLSKGTGTEYKDGVSKLIIYYYPCYGYIINIDNFINDDEDDHYDVVDDDDDGDHAYECC